MLYPEQFFVNMTSEAYTAMLEHHDFSNETQLEMGLQHCDLTKTLDQVGDPTVGDARQDGIETLIVIIDQN